MTNEPIGERIAVLETQVRTLGGETDSLRDTRHDHAAALQRHDLRIETNERAVDVITNRVVPEIQKTLERHADEIRRTREKEIKSGTDFGWILRILTFVLMIVVAIGEGVVMTRLEAAITSQATNSAPAKKP